MRGIEILLVDDFFTTDLAGRLRVEVVGPDGTVHTGRRHVRGFLPAGRHWIPVAAENLPTEGEALIRVRLDAEDGALNLRTDQFGSPVLNGMAPGGHGLRLAYADDVAIWENLDVLDRVRFAAEGVVVLDGQERVKMLQAGLPSELMVLSDQSDHLTGSVATTAVIHDFDDQLDHLSISLTSTGPGWLVVADAMQNGWVASVNDVDQPLVAADHALVGVPVPEGFSTIRLEYRPSGLKAGVYVSALSLALTLLLTWRRRRTRGDNHGSVVEPSSIVV